MQARAVLISIQACAHRAEGLYKESLAEGEEAMAARNFLSAHHQCVKLGFSEAVESAFALGDLDRVAEMLRPLAGLRAGELPPFLKAQLSRFEARLLAARGEPAMSNAASSRRPRSSASSACPSGSR